MPGREVLGLSLLLGKITPRKKRVCSGRAPEDPDSYSVDCADVSDRSTAAWRLPRDDHASHGEGSSCASQRIGLSYSTCFNVLCMAWHGMAWHGMAWHGMARHGTARHGTARHGTARHGKARHGTARHGMAWHGRHGTARHGTAWPGLDWHGTARHSTARHISSYDSCVTCVV